MNVPSNHEKSASRFEPYIKELRELFISHGIKVGSAEDIVPLATYLSAPGPIYDDITSIVRSIIFREHEAIPRPELLRLIVVAVAGSPIRECSDQVKQAIHQLKSYVGKVFASLRRGTFAEDTEEPESSLKELPAPESDFSLSTEFEQPSEEVEAREVKSATKLRKEDAIPPSVLPSSQASKAVPRFEEPKLGDAATAFQPPPTQLQILPAANLLPVPVRKVSHARRSAWIIGLAAMLLILIAGLIWRQRSTVQSAPTVQSVHKVQYPPEASTSHVVASTSALQSEPPTNLLPHPAGTSSTPHPESRQSKPSAINRGFSSAPNASAIQPVPPTAPLHPSQPSAQSNATPSPQVPPQPPARIPRRPRPAVGGQTGAPTPAAVAATAPGSFLVSSGVMDGNLITTPTIPKYPMMADMAGIEGKVILQAVVSRNGTVVATHVLDGHRLLRGAAAHAVRGWRYRPYLVHGKPADVATIVIVDFHLHH